MFDFLFQNAIASHESNGIDIIIALILNDINPLGKYRMDLVLELKVRLSSLCRSTSFDKYTWLKGIFLAGVRQILFF